MQVIFVCSGNKSNNKPGVVVQNQANSLIHRGIDIDFYIINKKGFIGYLKAIFPLVKKINQKSYSVIHAHYSLSGYVAGVAKMLARKKPKLITSLMGSDTQGGKGKMMLIQLFNRFFWNETIIKSSSMSKNFSKLNYKIIANGVDLMSIDKEVKKEHRENYILFPADPNRVSKNYDLAEQAIIHLGIEYELKTVYNRPHFEIIKHLKKCSCVLLTSKWEGSPNVIKEALACNTPIVSTKVGDIEKLIKGLDGCFLSEMNVESISESIKKAIDFSIKKGDTNGRQRLFELNLTAERVANQIIQLYEQQED
jgi:teichuronic acid biosynthesis glycosyltransferase TuaC